MPLPTSLETILVLLISIYLAFSYPATSEIVYPYNIGNIVATCPEGWLIVGTHCFLLINQSLPFSDANNFCLSPDNEPSVAFRIDNWFLTRTIVENYAQLQSLESHVVFWTGFYLIKSSNSFLPSYINRTFAINSTSIYNPLWASTEPDLDVVEVQYANSSNISCIAMDIDLNNEADYGWKLHDCNDRLPFICQTFICYDDDFRCKDNSGCVPRTAVCDNFTDCQDRSDEQNCTHDNCSIGNNFCHTSLPNDEQYCLNGGSCVFSEERDFSYCICPANHTGQRCETPTSYYNFNLYFTGNPSVEKNQTIVSVNIPPSFMREFSICGWVRYGTDSTIQRVHELIAGQQQLAPYAVLGIWNGTSVVQPIITFSNTGIQVTGQDDEKLHSNNFTLYTWHHFCVVSPRLHLTGWRYYLDGIMVDHNNQAGVSPEQNISILLGQNVEGTERFIGQLSLVQFYGKSLNDSDVASMAFDCIKYVKEYGADLTVAISWNQYTPVDKFNQGIQTIYPGICVTSSCIPGQPDCVKDKTPPTVVRCPSYTYLNESKRLTTVKWDESLDEMFYDNNYIVELTSNYRSGQTFTWGFYHVVYKARDAAGNLATCEFDLVIAKDVCTSPQAVNNRTNVTFTEVITEYTRKQANLFCADPTDVFNQPVPPFYTCDVMGKWNRFGQFSYFPGCSSTVNPSQTLNGTVIFYNLCENNAALVETVKQIILNSSQSLSFQYPGQQICSDGNCTNVIINPLCTLNQRRRRQVDNETVPIAFAIQTNLTSRDILPYVNGSMLANRLTIINPNHEISCDSSSENPQLHSSRTGDISCASCTAGQYFDQTECVPCPKNTYSTNGIICTHCTSPRNVTAGTGSSDPRSCYIDCDTGSYYSYATSNCIPCAQGTYQNQTGQLVCEQCPDQSTTSGTGAKISSDCHLCPAGQELDDTETCVACQNGTFRGAGSPSACVFCQPGFTTSKPGGTAPTDCNEINCPPGTYIKPNPPSPVDQTKYQLNDICVFCDYGYYEENYNASSCTICQSGYTTAQKGSKSPKDCVPGNTIRCNPYDQNSCPNGTTCAQKPNGGGYVCVPIYYGSRTQPDSSTAAQSSSASIAGQSPSTQATTTKSSSTTVVNNLSIFVLVFYIVLK